MADYKCKGCLIDSTHGKLQKKKEVLLEFIFAENSLCLTVSAQNVDIMAYTLSRDSIASVIATSELLVIIFKAKKQIKISAMGTNKLHELKSILDALVNDDLNGKINGQNGSHVFYLAYQIHVETFRHNSSKLNQSSHSLVANSSFRSDKPSPKPVKTDKMKHTIRSMENDENSQPTIQQTSKTIEKKKNTLHRYLNILFGDLGIVYIRHSLQCVEFLPTLSAWSVCGGTHRSRSFNPGTVGDH